jgi:hypothetical protein
VVVVVVVDLELVHGWVALVVVLQAVVLCAEELLELLDVELVHGWTEVEQLVELVEG